MPERTWKWSHRIFFPAIGAASLDAGMELWDQDVSVYDSATAIADALKRLGRQYDDDDIIYYATRTQLMDVVDAAGGVERSYARFHQSMALAQQTWEEWRRQLNRSPSENEGMGIGDPSVEDAWYSMDELIIWTRILLDRLRRRGMKKQQDDQGLIIWTRILLDRLRRRGMKKQQDDQGLIPAMAKGPRREAVIQARSRLLASAAGETRYLAGLNLHMQPLRPGSRGGRIRAGKVIIPFPDRVSGLIDHQLQLTYDSGRDASTFADEIMAAVERFMDELIAAFEQYFPERFKRPGGRQE